MPPPLATRINRFSNENGADHFRPCEVRFRWTLAELLNACGTPDREFPPPATASDGTAVYLAYRNVGAGIESGSHSAPWLLVALREGRAAKPGGPKPLVVEAVYGVASLPGPATAAGK